VRPILRQSLAAALVVACGLAWAPLPARADDDDRAANRLFVGAVKDWNEAAV